MNNHGSEELGGNRNVIPVTFPVRGVIFCGGFLFAILGMAGCAATLQNKDTHWVGIQCLEYATQGEGSPTVVFNSNTDMDSWMKVFPEVAKFTKVFADNRPGYGSSKPAMGQNTGTSVVERLHQLLGETGEHPPYVLVGHSYSGLFTNLFARTYPDEVVGVIFVDASHPAQEDWWHIELPGGTDPDLYLAKSSATRSEHGDISRARRGGCWADDGWALRSAFRLRFGPERRYDHIGFRVVPVPR